MGMIWNKNTIQQGGGVTYTKSAAETTVRGTRDVKADAGSATNVQGKLDPASRAVIDSFSPKSNNKVTIDSDGKIKMQGQFPPGVSVKDGKVEAQISNGTYVIDLKPNPNEKGSFIMNVKFQGKPGAPELKGGSPHNAREFLNNFSAQLTGKTFTDINISGNTVFERLTTSSDDQTPIKTNDENPPQTSKMNHQISKDFFSVVRHPSNVTDGEIKNLREKIDSSNLSPEQKKEIKKEIASFLKIDDKDVKANSKGNQFVGFLKVSDMETHSKATNGVGGKPGPDIAGGNKVNIPSKSEKIDGPRWKGCEVLLADRSEHKEFGITARPGTHNTAREIIIKGTTQKTVGG